MLSIKPRQYQTDIFLVSKEKNVLVVLPTGLGKTLIALLLSIDRIKLYPKSKVLFMAPTKPLIEQHFHYFTKQLPELFADLQLFTGSVEAKKRKEIWNTAEIIFSTPQCIANDIEKGLYNLSEVSLVIIDEAHRCLKNYDYTKVVSAYKRQSSMQRILGLTASPGYESDKIKQICQHLAIDTIESRTRESEDVKPYLQNLDYTKMEVPFPQEFIEIRTLLKRIYSQKIEELQKREFISPPVNKITLLTLQKRLGMQVSQRNFTAMFGLSLCAQAIKISHALELLETQTLTSLNYYMQSIVDQAKEKKSKGVQVIFNSPEFQASLVSLKNLLDNNIEHPKVAAIMDLIKTQFSEKKESKIIIFTQFRDTASLIVDRLNASPNTRAALFIGQANKRNAGLSQKEQKSIVEKFKTGEINILVATSIGEEGLDIPEVDAVIFYEPVSSAIRKIQRAGRTARLAPGKLVILVTQDTRDAINHYASSAREKKMHSTLERIKRDMQNKPINTKTLFDYK